MDIAAPAEGEPAVCPEEPGSEDKPRRDSATDAPVLRAKGFEWPLDWLLEMAREERIDLARLPIAELIGIFAAALEAALARGKALSPAASAMSLGCWGEWLVMAATLAWLRSRRLLPATAPEARAAHHEAETLAAAAGARSHAGGGRLARAAAPARGCKPKPAEFPELS